MNSGLKAVFAALLSASPTRALLLSAVVLAPSCKGKPAVGFEITLPSELAQNVAWFEVGAFRDARCEAVLPMLNDGVPEGAQTRLAFRRDAPTSPVVGELPVGTYAFAAVAKGEDCSVLATGCAVYDVGDADKIVIAMNATPEPTGACGTGGRCEAARCVPTNDNSDPSVGGNCSLELLGAGPLASPIGGGGTLVSAPAIATAPNGFVIAYREIDPNGSSARVTVLPIDSSGGAGKPERPALRRSCASPDETDGVGLLMEGTAGQVVLARAPCDADPGLEVLNFESTPAITIGEFLSADADANRLFLSDGHVTARTPSTGVVVFAQDGATRIATVLPRKGVSAPSGSFGGTAGMTGAWVAASDKVLAVLAAGPPGAPTIPAPVDAGADAGDGGAIDAGPEPQLDGGTLGPTLALVVAPASTPADQFAVGENKPRRAIRFPGHWGALAATGTRVIAMSDGSAPGRSVLFRTFDLDDTAPRDTNGFSVEGGDIVTGDVTIVDDKAYFAALRPGSVSLHVYASATTTPRFLREALFHQESRIPAMANVSGSGRVAVAASSTRVAVAWTTAKVLTTNDPTGGYAVFACAP